MSLRYQRFDPSSCRFPRPRVPVLPLFSLAEIAWTVDGDREPRLYRSAFAGQSEYFFSRGRYALHEAYRLSGIGAEGALLAPSYHCRTMLDPAISLGGEVLLYPLKPDLAPDMEALRKLISSSRKPIKALLLSHYFGFPQLVEPVADLCREYGIRLVEDCSHAYAGSSNGKCLGGVGDYAVASPYKFFACEDGGALLTNMKMVEPVRPLSAPSAKTELRAVLRCLLAAFRRSRDTLRLTDIRQIDAKMAQITASPLQLANDIETEDKTWSELYSPDQEGHGGLLVSRLIMRLSDVSAIAARRREHYRTWVAAVATLPHCRAIFPELPDGCVPYMFPLYIEHPEVDFYLLKHLGVPVWRWDDMALSSCGTAQDYRLHLIHLPCHQGLQSAELAWMIAAVSKVVGRIRGGGA